MTSCQFYRDTFVIQITLSHSLPLTCEFCPLFTYLLSFNLTMCSNHSQVFLSPRPGHSPFVPGLFCPHSWFYQSTSLLLASQTLHNIIRWAFIYEPLWNGSHWPIQHLWNKYPTMVTSLCVLTNCSAPNHTLQGFLYLRSILHSTAHLYSATLSDMLAQVHLVSL